MKIVTYTNEVPVTDVVVLPVYPNEDDDCIQRAKWPYNDAFKTYGNILTSGYAQLLKNDEYFIMHNNHCAVQHIIVVKLQKIAKTNARIIVHCAMEAALANGWKRLEFELPMGSILSNDEDRERENIELLFDALFDTYRQHVMTNITCVIRTSRDQIYAQAFLKQKEVPTL